MKLVTVVIPTYNRSRYILEAVNSAISQAYARLEVLVIDDGSTDDTAEKLQSLVRQGILRYEYQPNRGRSSARNRGIDLASGEFVTFLDSDDLFEPGKIQVQAEFLTAHPEVGMVHGAYQKFNDAGADLGMRKPSWLSGQSYPAILTRWSTLPATPAVMVPRQILTDLGGFDESMHVGEDLDLWRRIARLYPLGYIDRILARIRVHDGNTSSVARDATRDFEYYLSRAFEDDPRLSPWTKRLALSAMYANQALILMSESVDGALPAARRNAIKALTQNPLNALACGAFLLSGLGIKRRQAIVLKWRAWRTWLSARNLYR